MVKYRKNRERINVNALGSLYIDKELDENLRPVIYIGGQMEHRLHSFENKTGITFDVGHQLFDGSWFYEYSNKGTKSNINTENFADNLVKSLEAAKLDDVDIITESYGGLIAAVASKSKRIHKVVAIHPPILGTPLASNDTILDALTKLGNRQKAIACVVSKIVNDRFGFEQDNAKGINDPRILDAIDLSKLTVVGSNIDREKEKSKLKGKLVCALYDLIYAITEEKSDGVVIYNEETLRKYGINYFTEIAPKNHFDAGSETNLKRYAHKYLDGYEFEETEEFEETKDFDLNNSIPEKNIFLLGDRDIKAEKDSNGGKVSKISKNSTKKNSTKRNSAKQEIKTLENRNSQKETFSADKMLFNTGNPFLKKFVAGTKDKFLNDIYYLDGQEKPCDDTIDFEDEYEEDGIKFFSVDKLFEEEDAKKSADLARLHEKVEEERKLALQRFTKSGNR